MKATQIISIKALLLARLFLWILILNHFGACKKEQKANVSWEKIESGVQHPLRAIAAFANNDSVFVCGGTEGQEGVILLSQDGGSTWKTIFSLDKNAFYGLYFKNSLEGFALAEYSDIFSTKDGGQTWNRMLRNDTVAFRYRLKLRDFYFRDAQTAFCVGGNNFGSGTILRSNDLGNSWSTVATVEHELRSIYFISAEIGFASGYGVLLKTSDAGQTWLPTDLSDDFFTSMCFLDNEKAFISGYNGSLYKSSDSGNNWKQIIKGNSMITAKRRHFNDIEFYDSNYGMAVGEAGYVLLTDDGGASWKSSENEEKNGMHQLHFKNAKQGLIVADAGTIYKFTIE